MRSVFVYLRDTGETELAAWVDSVARRGADGQWNYPKEGPPVLVVWPGYNPAEFEPDELAALHAALGGAPSAALGADVLGGYDGTSEVKQFVTDLLARFPGVAADDVSEHLWRRDEIVSGAQYDGLGFFDYMRWRSALRP